MPDTGENVALPAGYRLVFFDVIDSTNAEALRRLEAGSGAGEIIWACRQRAGRGRRGRVWQSPDGNLYMTLTVALPAGRAAGQLAFVAALGVGEALRPSLPDGDALRYKWPNDLMLGDAKLGGILIEGAAGLFAVGIGINVAHAPEGAACMAQVRAAAPLPGLVQAVCREFDRWYRIWATDGFAPVREAWLAHAHRVGTPIEARFPDGSAIRGIFREIDTDGALILQCDDGTVKCVAMGEVFFAAA